jgi:hypothetical protein
LLGNFDSDCDRRATTKSRPVRSREPASSSSASARPLPAVRIAGGHAGLIGIEVRTMPSDVLGCDIHQCEFVTERRSTLGVEQQPFGSPPGGGIRSIALVFWPIHGRR